MNPNVWLCHLTFLLHIEPVSAASSLQSLQQETKAERFKEDLALLSKHAKVEWKFCPQFETVCLFCHKRRRHRSNIQLKLMFWRTQTFKVVLFLDKVSCPLEKKSNSLSSVAEGNLFLLSTKDTMLGQLFSINVKYLWITKQLHIFSLYLKYH